MAVGQTDRAVFESDDQLALHFGEAQADVSELFFLQVNSRASMIGCASRIVSSGTDSALASK